jgi:hypothetical protein
MCAVKNSLKQGDALIPLLFNFALQYAFRLVQVNQDGLKLNGTHQFLVYTDEVGGSAHTIKKSTEVLVVASKEIGLEVILLKLSTWSCLKIRIQGKVTI